MNTRKPNLVYIFADQMRAEALPNMGDPYVVAPNLERLAAEGVTLTRTYSNHPVCGPARGSMITGMYCYTHGVVTNNLQLRTDITSIAHVYGSHGYETGYIGKWHLDGAQKPGFVPPGERRQGFEYWAGFNRGHAYWDFTYFRDEETPITMTGYEPDHQTELAVDFINRNHDKPFCLFMSWGPPHSPLMPPEGVEDEKFKHFNPDAIEQLRPNVDPSLEKRSKRELAAYNIHIQALDRNIGIIMDALQQQGISDNTILVFTCDHGDMIGSHGFTANVKSKPYEESSHIPFIIRYPDRLEKGKKNDTLFSIVDFMPTLLSLSSLPIPDSVQGKDKSEFILHNDGSSIGPDSVYIGLSNWRAIRTQKYMYAVNFLNKNHLYDMDADPYQMNNLAGNSDYSEVEKNLNERLLQWAKEVNDSKFIG